MVTVTEKTPGTGGNSIATTSSLTGFAWGGQTMSGGTDGETGATTFGYWSVNAPASTTQLAANIATAINDNTTLQNTTTGVSASSSGNQVIVTANSTGTAANSYGTTVANFGGYTWGNTTLTGGALGARVQPNMFPAKYSFSTTTETCSDYVVFPTGTAGGTGAASIVAYNNLYAGTGACIAAGASPPPYWAYNTGGTATTSPVLSLDGTQLAFIQVSGTTAALVVLKPAAGGTPTLPLTLTSEPSAAAYRACTAPCMYTMAFANGANDTFSAPFYVYQTNVDLMFVGDDSGNLHEFTGAFLGNPAEAGTPWPVNLGSAKLSVPVYDNASGYVIVGDFAGALHSVTASTGVLHSTVTGIGDVLADAPLVDSNAGILFTFVTSSGSYSWTNYNAIYELSVGFASGTPSTVFPGVEPVSSGAGNTGYYLYAGTFDNVYYQQGPSVEAYAVGNTGLTTGASLFRVPIIGAGMAGSTAVVTGLNSTLHPWPSPVTEFCNNGASHAPPAQRRPLRALTMFSSALTVERRPGVRTLPGTAAFSPIM